jgi:hypothetical protein
LLGEGESREEQDQRGGPSDLSIHGQTPALHRPRCHVGTALATDSMHRTSRTLPEGRLLRHRVVAQDKIRSRTLNLDSYRGQEVVSITPGST